MTDATFDPTQVQAELDAQVAASHVKEAVQEDADEGVTGDFTVSNEEVMQLRAAMATDFPDDFEYLSDAYIKSVASKPYSKDPTQRRPLEYSQEKLLHVLKWRAENGAPDMEELVDLANGSPNAPAAVEDPARLKKAHALATSLNYASTYWHGFTKDGRPILWVRTNRKPWYPDVEAEVNALMVLADAGIKNMPPHVTDFVAISESSYPPPPNPQFMINLLKGLVRGYPDRLNLLISAPVSSIIQFVMNLLLPLMPGRLASKVVLLSSEKMKERLEDLLLNGAEDVPTFFGGPADHDQYYPEEAKCPNRGQGKLKFDYFGMVERLEAARDDYVKNRPSK